MHGSKYFFLIFCQFLCKRHIFCALNRKLFGRTTVFLMNKIQISSEKLVRITYNKYVWTIEVREPSSLTFFMVHIITKLTLFPSTTEAWWFTLNCSAIKSQHLIIYFKVNGFFFEKKICKSVCFSFIFDLFEKLIVRNKKSFEIKSFNFIFSTCLFSRWKNKIIQFFFSILMHLLFKCRFKLYNNWLIFNRPIPKLLFEFKIILQESSKYIISSSIKDIFFIWNRKWFI